MRAPLRLAITFLRSVGFEVNRIRQASRHTEVHFNGSGLVRIHRGNRVSPEFERNLRTIIQKASQGENVMNIITVDQRLAEKTGAKILIAGPSGVGKTSLLRTMPPQTLEKTL